VAGIAADLVETLNRELGLAVIAGMLAANALWAVSGFFAIGK